MEHAQSIPHLSGMLAITDHITRGSRSDVGDRPPKLSVVLNPMAFAIARWQHLWDLPTPSSQFRRIRRQTLLHMRA